MPPNTTASSGQQPGKSRRKKGRKARLIVLVLVLALVGGVGYGGYWSISTVRASFPQTKGSISLDGISAPVDVKRDGNGIPQIYASSDEDLFMAQGYVQAQDRFYEMDVRRRHDLRAPLGDVRQGPGRQRRIPAHPRLGPCGERGVRHQAVARHEEVPPGIRQGSQRLPGGQGRRGNLPGVRGARVQQRLQAREVDPGRLGGLAEGDGLGPARQHAGRDRPRPDDQPPGPQADRGPVPGLPVRPEQADRPGRPVRRPHGDLRAERQRERHLRNVHGRHDGPVLLGHGLLGPPDPADGPLRRPRRPPHGRRRERQRHRLQRLGRRRQAHHHRQAAAGQRPAPVGLAAVRLVPDGPALPLRLQQVPVRRQRLHLRGHARRRHRPQPEHLLGHDQLRRRRHRPLPAETHRQRLPVQRQGQAVLLARGDHQGHAAAHRRRSSSGRPRTRRPRAERPCRGCPCCPTATTSW